MIDSMERLRAAIGGRYALERELGAGGMATVYLARDVRHHRPVAIKVLHPELARAVGSARFLREIEVAASLNHPHILPLHDSGEAEGVLYYVMPWVEEGSLQDRLSREGQLPVRDALRLAREVADALAYAHARGVVHRDVKPANILLESDHALVSDFGVALLADAALGDRFTDSGYSPGTPLYMSPEQASGEAELDGRSDVYSLGCVLYEMLAGAPPFPGPNPRAVIARKIVDPVPSLTVVRETIAPALERVVLTALARAPADRYTGAELVRALDDVTLEQGGATRSGATHPVVASPVRRAPASPLAWLGTGSLLLAALLAVLTVVGFLTAVTYDVVMVIPSEFIPSRRDFPVLGVRSLIPAGLWLLVLTLAFLTLRVLAAGAARLPGVRPHVGRWSRGTRARWRDLLDRLTPAAAADLYLVGTVAGSALALLVFWLSTVPDVPFFELLPASLGGSADDGAGILACAYRPIHRTFDLVLTGLVVVLAITWRGTFRYLERRSGGGGRVALARWAGLGWILALLFLMTLPWRLLWNNQHPRALLGGERAYVLLEEGSDLVLYNAERGSTVHYRASSEIPLERLSTTGYVFEDAQAFAGPSSGC